MGDTGGRFSALFTQNVIGSDSVVLLLILVRRFCVRNEMRLHAAVSRKEQLRRGAGMEGAATSEEAHRSVFFVSKRKVGTVCWRKC